ncbi:AglZ/HisF2 family acetamidino modification protein [Pseudomonas auratipiscis]|uniref:imidazole glycerol-phosphate synthase n=1 Tax=Pseudomonas auratipiscis TaxID=3115853 RepID=A0AB35WVS3_9PSED|nr:MULTISPECIES: AglZ/HisF2 family acetamidino modification protein [unclassified Pseudomonas]MEE1867170.1 AglZ/HisF2 family acetamidino modification protein [Pseudomonas sp. 120P]MEE1957997.1 AglZ/HisF2 family acetamidino modification protein [Pseudomonas sp. 119P]
MYRARVIPCLLIRDNGLVKTRKFKDPVYIGDPVNPVRIFSDKEVDEIIVLDIDASRKGKEPNYALIEEIAGEAFMPLAYGGGIRTVDQVRRLIRSGIEKVVINTAAFDSMDVISEAADIFGSQAVVGAIDVRKTLFGGNRLITKCGSVEANDEHVDKLVAAGVGEIFLNSIDRDGMMSGYDVPLIQSVARRVNVPVMACGGAGTLNHMAEAVREGGASAVAAGSMFVFHGKHRAVLINYPQKIEF